MRKPNDFGTPQGLDKRLDKMTAHNGGGFRTLEELRGWCSRAPRGTVLDASELADLLAELDVQEELEDRPRREPMELTWRERLWLVPAETRIGAAELAEALGRPRSWVYARTQSTAEDPVPHRKLDGTLTFTAGEVRAWIRDREEVVAAGRMDSTAAERGLSLVEGGD